MNFEDRPNHVRGTEGKHVVACCGDILWLIGLKLGKKLLLAIMNEPTSVRLAIQSSLFWLRNVDEPLAVILLSEPNGTLGNVRY